MGQYFYVVNLDKKEFLHPHKLGIGLKLGELCQPQMMAAIVYLTSSNEGDGRQGSWRGDRIAIEGDYAHGDSGSNVHAQCSEEGSSYRDISLEVRAETEQYFPWVKFEKRWDDWDE